MDQFEQVFQEAKREASERQESVYMYKDKIWQWCLGEMEGPNRQIYLAVNPDGSTDVLLNEEGKFNV